MSLYDDFQKGKGITPSNVGAPQDSFLKKTARVLLPKEVEYKIGLTPRPTETKTTEPTKSLYEQFKEKQTTAPVTPTTPTTPEVKTTEDYATTLSTPVFNHTIGIPKSTVDETKRQELLLEERKKSEPWYKKTARVLLPKGAEKALGFDKPPSQEEEVFNQYEEAYAKSDLTRLQKQLAEGGGKLPKQNFGDVIKETKPETYMPFFSSIPEIADSIKLYQAAKRFENGQATMLDEYLLTKYVAENNRDRTFGANVAKILTQVPAFAGELYLTGGTYSAGKKATEKVIAKTLEKAVGKTAGKILTKSTGSIVGGTLQTIPAGALRITTGTIQNMTPELGLTQDELGKMQVAVTEEGDDLIKALSKAGFDQWVETVSEHSGGLLTEALAPIKNQFLRIGIIKSLLKANPTKRIGDVLAIAKKAGWNGVLEEMFEERIGEVARGVGTMFGLSEQRWVIPSPQQLATELVAFAIPGAMIGIADKASGGGKKEEYFISKQPQQLETSTPQTEIKEQTEKVDTKTGETIKSGGFQDIYLKQTMKPAEYIARVIDRKLTGQENLRESPKGAALLKEQLAKEEKVAKEKAADERLNDVVDFVLGKRDMPKEEGETKYNVVNMGEGQKRIDTIDKSGWIKFYEEGDKIIVPDFQVKEGERNKGIGTGLLNEVEKIAKELGKDVQLSALADNGTSPKSLVDFYKKRGYVENGSGEMGVGMIKKIAKVESKQPTGITLPSKTVKQQTTKLTYLDNEINKKIEKFRQEADIMADRNQAGKRMYTGPKNQVEDAVYLYTKKGAIKGDMYKMAHQSKKYAHDMLYEYDKEYKRMYDERLQLEENKIEDTSNDINVNEMFGIVEEEITQTNEFIKNNGTPEEISQAEEITSEKETELQDKYGEKGLRPELKKFEKEAFAQIEKEGADVIIQRFFDKYGEVLNSDDLKTMFDNYEGNETKSLGFQKPASYLFGKAFDILLDKHANDTNKNVMAMMGGTGSGKTTSRKNVPAVQKAYEGASFVLDTTFANEKVTQDTIQKIIDKGYRVRIFHILRDPMDAWENGALLRKRTVTIDSHVNTHVGSRDMGLDLAKNYYATPGNTGEIEYTLVKNKYNENPVLVTSKEGAVDLLKNQQYNEIEVKELKKQLYVKLEQKLKAGEITEAFFKGSTEKIQPNNEDGSAIDTEPEGEYQKKDTSELETTKKTKEPPTKAEGGFNLFKEPDYIKNKAEVIVNNDNLRIEVKQLDNGKWIGEFESSNGNIGHSEDFQKFSSQFDTRQEVINDIVDGLIKYYETPLATKGLSKSADMADVTKTTRTMLRDLNNLENFSPVKKQEVTISKEGFVLSEMKSDVMAEMDRLGNLMDQEGVDREKIIDQNNKIRDAFNEYADKNEKIAYQFKDKKGKQVVEIKVLQFADDKWTSHQSIMLSESGWSNPYDGIYDTKKEATDSAKKEVVDRLKEFTDISKADEVNIKKVLEELGVSESKRLFEKPEKQVVEIPKVEDMSREDIMAEMANNTVGGTYFDDLTLEKLREELTKYREEATWNKPRATTSDEFSTELGKMGYTPDEIVEFNKMAEDGEFGPELPKTTGTLFRLRSDRLIDQFLDDKGTKFRVSKNRQLISVTAPFSREVTSRFFQHPDIVGKDELSYSFLANLAKSTSVQLKLIERETIQKVLESPQFKDQKVDMEEFKRAVQVELLPLDIIPSTSWSDYGSDNIGLGDTEHKTYLLNSPYEHRETGHFGSDFGRTVSSGDVEIKEIVPQPGNPTAKFAVVLKGVGLTEANMADSVFTVTNTKEQAQAWIDSHSTNSGDYVIVNNSGLFAHVRTFDSREKIMPSEQESISHVAEIQSDPFQKNVMDKTVAGQIKGLQEDMDFKKERITNYKKMMESYGEESFSPNKNMVLDYEEKIAREKKWLKRNEEELASLQKKTPSTNELLFSSYRNIWQERSVREIISLKANEGFKTLRFPTARTVAVIEGFAGGENGDTMPYEIPNRMDARREDLEVGEEIEYGGETYTVISVDDRNITVAPSDKVHHFNHNDAMEEEIQYRWDEVKSSFQSVEQDFGSIKNAEQAQAVIDKIAIYNKQVDFINKVKDIKNDKEWLKGRIEKVGEGAKGWRIDKIKELIEESAKTIKQIQTRTKPTKEEFATLPKKLQGSVANGYKYNEYDAEQILKEIIDQDLNELSDDFWDKYEEEWKNDSYQNYDPDYEGIYGKGHVFFEGDNRNPEVWTTENDTEQFLQPDQYEETADIENFSIDNFSGEQKTVLQFYEKQVNPYVEKIRKGNIEKIVDDNGYEWYETKLTDADKMPPTAYRLRENLEVAGFKITDKQQEALIALNQNIFGDNNIQIVEQIIENKDALASYESGMIKILDGEADYEDSFYHEAGHKYLDVFTGREEHKAILKQAQQRFKGETMHETEEKLMENIIKYAKTGKGFWGSLKVMIDRWLLRVKKFFGAEDKITQFYNDIVTGQARKATPAMSPELGAVFREADIFNDMGPLTDEEIEAFNLVQDGEAIPENLRPAIELLKDRGLISQEYVPPVEVIRTSRTNRTPKVRPPVKPMQPGEKISERGIILRRNQQSVPRPYILTYMTGNKRVVRTFEKREDVQWIYEAMVNVRKTGAMKQGELPPELQPTNEQKQIIHMIVQAKKITPRQYKKLAEAYTGVDSTLKMTPEQADHFTDMLRELKPKFGGKITVPMTKELVLAEMAERKFKDIRAGWVLNIFRSPRNVFRRIGIAPEVEQVYTGMELRRDFVNHTFGKISEWQKELGLKGIHLFNKEKIRQQSARMFNAMNTGDMNGLTDEEKLIVGRAQELAKGVADLVDDSRHEIGLEPMNRKENYITNLLTDEGHFLIANTKQAPNELYAILDMKLPSKIFNRLLLQRRGGLPIKQDFWKAMKAMTQMHAKYIYLNPPVHRLEKFMKFFGDTVPYLSRKYINGRIKRFLGRPTLVESFLRSVDDSITKLFGRLPFMSKQYEIELQNGITEVLNVPRINLKITQGAIPMLKSIRYMYDLTWSVSFYAINLTQFWLNTVPKLRGNAIDIYRSAISAYAQMTVDFFRPSRWEYWRQRGVLTEIDNVIDNEYRSRFGGSVLNIFAKLSEFNNRVASTLATEKNIALLVKKGKADLLYKELNKRYGEEAKEYARNLADLTQFRYGIEEKPVAFDNPLMDMYYQYNTFAIKQAELVEGMAENTNVKKLLPDLREAYKNNKVKEFLAELTQGQRGDLIRFILNAFLLSLILGSGFIWDAVFKGMIPSQITGLKDVLVGLWEGDKDLRSKGYKAMLTPPAWTLVERVSEYGIKATILNIKAIKQLNLLYSVLTGESVEIKNIAGKTIEKITPDVAGKRLIASTKEKTAQANSKSLDLYNKIDSEYSSTRKKAIALLQNGRKEEARNLVKLYNNRAMTWIKQLKELNPTDLRLKDILGKISKSHIVDSSNFDDWKETAKEL